MPEQGGSGAGEKEREVAINLTDSDAKGWWQSDHTRQAKLTHWFWKM